MERRLAGRVAHPEQLRHFFVEKAPVWTVRLDPFAVYDKLRDGSLTHVSDNLLRSARGVLDVDFGIGNPVFFKKAFGFAAVAAPRGGIDQHMHLFIIPVAGVYEGETG
jgi:hypothetical protein